MQFLLILSLIIAILAVIFAVYNTEPVTVEFLSWSFEGSLALVLIMGMLVGVLISLLASTPSIVKNKLAIRSLNKQLTKLQKKLDEQASQLIEAQNKIQEQENELEAARNPKPPEVINDAGEPSSIVEEPAQENSETQAQS